MQISCLHVHYFALRMTTRHSECQYTRQYSMAYQDLQRLEAASSDFRTFCRACEQMEEWWGQTRAWRVVDDDLIHFGRKHVDEVSQRIIPADFREMSLVPVKSTGDGNCLFNSASLVVCQAETLALEL